jgi:uncharacterized protein YacL
MQCHVFKNPLPDHTLGRLNTLHISIIIVVIIIIIIIFIYCNCFSTRWQWLVDLYKNRKETAQKDKKYTKQYKNTKYTKNTK